MFVKSELKQIVKKLRLTLDLNQTDFGKRIGRSISTVQNFERGTIPSIDDLEKMVKIADDRGLLHLSGALRLHLQSGKDLIAGGRRAPQNVEGTETWHRLLDEILASGEADAVNAVQSNLVVFANYIRSKHRPPPDARTRGTKWKGQS